MDKIYIKARAKVNLTLEILEKRPDNYHNLKSVFQKVNLYDELYVEKSEHDGCEILTNVEKLNSKDNIIYKAYVKLREEYPQITGIKVNLNKKIPMEAGLAGGSTDCASFLVAMNKLFNLNMNKEKFENIGKGLGADVVPCFYNKALLAEGIGEMITPIHTNFKYYIVIIKPHISCSTKEMFKKLDEREKIKQKENSNKIIEALQEHNLKKLTNNLYDVFEEVMEEKEIIENIKKELIQNGALGSLMTGSGSCVYGIFENKEIAKNAYNALKLKYQTYITTSYNSKKEIKL